MRFTTLVLLALAGRLTAGELVRDDFSRYPPREFSLPVKELTNALHEYHYVAHRGVRLDPWENSHIDQDAWAGGDEDGKTYVEMHIINDKNSRNYNPTLVIGDPEWSDYTVEAKVRPLLMADMGGIVFRYHTNRHYYLFALTGGNKARLALRLTQEKKMATAEWKELGSANFQYDATRYYTLKVEK
jgi:hypothetical protein